ncbi:dihydroorotate dehydrogenase electron transfer subunit [Senegalia massiliensis]|uniref:dihydroorotate dehydrogenase electron transfer subunit n=1 Tax=Senegalia massiliensis TaxID=1720316 RepID=UPI001031B738|nr:dihydroorotate dehydrogenase electron transfer subunit [Senegalia massiliensis]
MAKILENIKVSDRIYKLIIEGKFHGEMGQFFMIRGWGDYPLLSRPLSIHDKNNESITFLYRVEGIGTNKLTELSKEDNVKLEGPYGNGYPTVKGKIAIVGGGIGIAPLLYTAKNLKNRVKELDIYLGFTEKEYLTEEFWKYADNLYVSVGDFITEKLNVDNYDHILTCGPEIMMRKIVDMSKDKNVKTYVSIEKHMACGVGACLVCSCKTKNGMSRVCKDGPVYPGEDVFYE